MLDAYRQLIERLLSELANVECTLTRVMCHGDTHGFNNHVTTDADGVQRAAFFDFDDAGPGFLTYDLCVWLWSNLPRKAPMEPDEALLKRWQQYLAGYRAGAAVSPMPTLLPCPCSCSCGTCGIWGRAWRASTIGAPT